MSLSKRYLAVFAVALAVCMAGTAAYADTAIPSTEGWTLTPIVGDGTVQFLLGIDNTSSLASYAGEVSKTWGDAGDPTKYIALGDTGGFLQSLTVTLDGDPKVRVQFSVLAGATDTSFTITPLSSTPPGPSPVVFAPLVNPLATATAALTVTDFDGNGAWVSPGYQDGTFYKATYNTNQTFASLIDRAINDPAPGNIVAAPDGSKTGDGFKAWTTIPGSITSMTAEFKFTLSANDLASGTGSFTIVPVPEPGSMLAMFTGIVGMAGVLVRRRRA